MKDRLYEQIVFCKDNYNGSKEELFRVVTEQLKILLDAGYLAVVRYDEPSFGIVVIEYEHDEHEEVWGCANPVWITPDEEDAVIAIRENNASENVKLGDLE